MADYTKTTNFASKDSLPSGNANKIVKGAEIDTEFNNIATALATKANIASPAFTGVVSMDSLDIGTTSIDSSGHTIIPAGITLGTSAGTYAAANTLDDYEEGSFIMYLHDAASGGNQSSTSATAYYTKIGNQVTVYVYGVNNIDTTGMTAGNSLYFALPFTASSVGRAVGSVIHHGFTYDGDSNYEDIKPYVATGSARGLFATVGYGRADSSVKVSDVSSGVDDIHTLTLTYFV